MYIHIFIYINVVPHKNWHQQRCFIDDDDEKTQQQQQNKIEPNMVIYHFQTKAIDMGETEFIGILLDSFFSAEIKIGTRVSHAFFQEHPFFLVRLLSKFNYNYDEM